MTLTLLLTVLGSISLSAIAQILMKLGMSSTGVQKAAAAGSAAELALAAVTNPLVFAGLAAYAVGAVAWLFVLSRLDVSLAYPFVSLGFVMVVALSVIVLGEQVTPLRIGGLALIVAGVVLVGRSAPA